MSTPGKRGYNVAFVTPPAKRARMEHSASTVIAKFYRKRRNFKNKLFEQGSGIPERKVLLSENSTGSQTVSYTPVFQYVSGIAQGTALSQRVGNKVLLTSFQIKGCVGNAPTQLATWEALNIGARTVRIVVVYDHAPNGAAPSFSDIYDQSGSSVYWPFANRVPANMERFTVLMDENHVQLSGGPNGFTFEKYVKMSLPCVFNNTTSGAITGATIGALWVVFVDNNGSAANQGNVQWRAKLQFTDD